MEQEVVSNIMKFPVLEGDHLFNNGLPILLYVETLKSCTITIGRDTEVSLLVVSNTSWDLDTSCKIILAAPCARFTGCMIESLSSEQVSGLNITMLHEAANTSAWCGVRTYAQGASRSDVRSSLKIPKHIKAADAYFSHHALAGDGTTRVTTIPALEIESNEVKAGHAASVSTFDRDQLFYLESRGLDRIEATRLLSVGFLKSDLSHLPQDLSMFGAEIIETLIA